MKGLSIPVGNPDCATLVSLTVSIVDSVYLD